MTYKEQMSEMLAPYALPANTDYAGQKPLERAVADALLVLADMLDQAQTHRTKVQGTNPLANLVTTWAKPEFEAKPSAHEPEQIPNALAQAAADCANDLRGGHERQDDDVFNVRECVRVGHGSMFGIGCRAFIAGARWQQNQGDVVPTSSPENDAISSSEAQWRITLAQKDERISELETLLAALNPRLEEETKARVAAEQAKNKTKFTLDSVGAQLTAAKERLADLERELNVQAHAITDALKALFNCGIEAQLPDGIRQMGEQVKELKQDLKNAESRADGNLLRVKDRDKRIIELERELSESRDAQEKLRAYLEEIQLSIVGGFKTNLRQALNALDVPDWKITPNPDIVNAIHKATAALGDFAIMKGYVDQINATLKPLNLPGPSVAQTVEQLVEQQAKLETVLKEQYVEKRRLVEAERRGHEIFKVLEEFGDGVCRLIAKAGGPPHHKVYGWTGEDANRVPMRASMYWLEQRLKDQPKAESTAEPHMFGDALVERLAKSAWEWSPKFNGTTPYEYINDAAKSNMRRTVERIFSELSKTNIELPTEEQIRIASYDIGNADGVMTLEAAGQRVAKLFREHLASQHSTIEYLRGTAIHYDNLRNTLAELGLPTGHHDELRKAIESKDAALANKTRELEQDQRQCLDALAGSNLVPPGRTVCEGIMELVNLHAVGKARIVELEKQNQKLTTQRDEEHGLSNMRAIEIDTWKERVVEARTKIEGLETELAKAKSSIEWYLTQIRTATADLGFFGSTLEQAVEGALKRQVESCLAPPVVDGKTPGELFINAYDAYLREKRGSKAHEFAAQAVFDKFGKQATRETLERVRDRITKDITHVMVGHGNIVHLPGNQILAIIDEATAALDSPTAPDKLKEHKFVSTQDEIRGAFFWEGQAGSERSNISFANGRTMEWDYAPLSMKLDRGDIIEIRVIERADR